MLEVMAFQIYHQLPSTFVNDFQKVLHSACAIKIPIATGRVNIRIHRDVTGEMWFGVGRI